MLPDSIGKSIYPTSRSIHSGMHNTKSYGDILEKVKDVLKEGPDNHWGSIHYKNKIAELISGQLII